MAQNQNKGAITAKDKVVMYRAIKFTITRDKDRIIYEDVQSRYFTSKRKAVDALRMYAEGWEKVADRYEKYQQGRCKDYEDRFISLGTYEECEGCLVRTETAPYQDMLDGQLTDYTKDSCFETF